MAKTESTTNTTSSVDVPFYKKYPTPIYNKDELHRTFGGVYDDYDFSMHYQSMLLAAEKTSKVFEFNNKNKKKSLKTK